MSEKNVEKKCTVEEFCKKYNELASDVNKQSLVKKYINFNYIPYEVKVATCNEIINRTYYKMDEDGISLKLHVNSPVQYMLFSLNIVDLYTGIKINFENALNEFNELNKNGVLDMIVNFVPEKEIKELRVVLDMVENDIIQNEYETSAFLSKQFERFGNLFGHIVAPALNRFSDVLENMDEKTTSNLINKLNKIIHVVKK